MYQFIFLIFGIVIGVTIMRIRMVNKCVGRLRIDNSDIEDSPYIFLEIDKDSGGIENISNQRYVVLEVSIKDYISQK